MARLDRMAPVRRIAIVRARVQLNNQPLKQLPMPGQTVQAFCQKVGMAMAKVELRF